jgi:hypothetical protein
VTRLPPTSSARSSWSLFLTSEVIWWTNFIETPSSTTTLTCCLMPSRTHHPSRGARPAQPFMLQPNDNILHSGTSDDSSMVLKALLMSRFAQFFELHQHGDGVFFLSTWSGTLLISFLVLIFQSY